MSGRDIIEERRMSGRWRVCRLDNRNWIHPWFSTGHSGKMESFSTWREAYTYADRQARK